jgi:AcrR family transcriptional regulator
MTGRRARTPQDKADRRASILEAAGSLFDAGEPESLTMDAVAHRLGLVKGTLYRYVPTREALLLDLLVQELGDWFTEVDRSLLDAGRGPDARRNAHRGAATADLLVDSVVARTRMVRLTAMLPSILERNIPVDTAHGFKSWLLGRTLVTGAAIDDALGVPDGAGTRLLVHLQAAVVGLHSHAFPAPAVRAALDDPALAPLRLDFPTELRHVVRALVAGATSPSSEPDHQHHPGANHD